MEIMAELAEGKQTVKKGDFAGTLVWTQMLSGFGGRWLLSNRQGPSELELPGPELWDKEKKDLYPTWG